jgi:1-acyl-sn-glycerol-3-phosphate acyltransferase
MGRLLLRLFGWTVEGRFPDEKKLVVVVAPHTSNWDFFIGIACVWAIGVRISFMIKRNAFKGPSGGVLKYLGGIPIDRAAAHGVVDQMVEAFERRDALVLAITPEGTRKKVESWKTGFYHIAERAGVPMLLVYFDYRRKVVGFGPVRHATENIDKDIQDMRDFYEQFEARNPELA